MNPAKRLTIINTALELAPDNFLCPLETGAIISRHANSVTQIGGMRFEGADSDATSGGGDKVNILNHEPNRASLSSPRSHLAHTGAGPIDQFCQRHGHPTTSSYSIAFTCSSIQSQSGTVELQRQ